MQIPVNLSAHGPALFFAVDTHKVKCSDFLLQFTCFK